MAPGGIVPSLDEFEDCHARLRLGLELAPIEQLVFQCSKEALAHGVVKTISDRPHGWAYICLFAPQTETHGGVLRTLIGTSYSEVKNN